MKSPALPAQYLAKAELTPAQIRLVEAYLRRAYAGVFTDSAIRSHLENHVGFGFAEYAMQVVLPHAPSSGELLDIGCGFGSCVLAARAQGLNARGVDLAEFDVKIAQERLARAEPAAKPTEVFRVGDARDVDIADAGLDVVTLWNVVEHIPDYGQLLVWVHRKLRPGGSVYIVCPNYAALRLEAHYHVPWYPLFPRRRAAAYLRRRGKDPRYFEEAIFYRTNWGVLRTLWRVGFSVYEIGNDRCLDLRLRNLGSLRRNWRSMLEHLNPVKASVVLAARRVS
jgi:MPBQ/MSBQ methyltransferase